MTGMGTKMITQKQENYALNLFKGMSQRTAYIEADYSTNMLEATMDREACELAKNPNVATRLEELNRASDSENVASVLERKETLTKIIRKEHTDRYKIPIYTPKLQAIDLLSKLDGAYAPVRHELTG